MGKEGRVFSRILAGVGQLKILHLVWGKHTVKDGSQKREESFLHIGSHWAVWVFMEGWRGTWAKIVQGE